MEGSALIYRSLGPTRPSMPVDDALNGSQSYASAFKFFRQVETLKHTEQFIYILHVETRAVVPDEHL